MEVSTKVILLLVHSLRVKTQLDMPRGVRFSKFLGQ